jgi:cytochrome c553
LGIFAAKPFQSVQADAKEAGPNLCGSVVCHLGGSWGQNEIPRVAGQYPPYVKKLETSGGAPHQRGNDSVAGTLSDADIENLSQYIGNLN